MKPTYTIFLWDHEAVCDGRRRGGQTEGGWSGELARQHLEGPNTGLTQGQLKRALRTLYDHGWDFVTIYVEKVDPPSLFGDG